MAESAFEAIEDHLRASWSETPLVFENEDFGLADAPEPFVYVEVVADSMAQDTFGAPGANQWLETGGVYLHVMTPSGTGSRAARQIGERLMYLFREQPLQDIHFRDMSLGAGDPGKTFGGYFAITVTVDWERHDFTNLP